MDVIGTLRKAKVGGLPHRQLPALKTLTSSTALVGGRLHSVPNRRLSLKLSPLRGSHTCDRVLIRGPQTALTRQARFPPGVGVATDGPGKRAGFALRHRVIREPHESIGFAANDVRNCQECRSGLIDPAGAPCGSGYRTQRGRSWEDRRSGSRTRRRWACCHAPPSPPARE